MWGLRKSEEQLTDEDKDVLVDLFEHSPCLKMAYEWAYLPVGGGMSLYLPQCLEGAVNPGQPQV